MLSGQILVIVVYFVGLATGKSIESPKDNISRRVKKLRLTANGRTLDPNARTFKKKIADHLYGENLETEVEVWENMAELNDMVAKTNNKPVQRSARHDIDDVDAVIEGDILLDKKDLQDMMDFYHKHPEFLKLDGANTARKHSKREERKFRAAIEKGDKWKMPIQYKIGEGVNDVIVKEAMKAWEEETCIRFKQRGENAHISGPNIIFIQSKSEKQCASHVGKKPTNQTVWLGSKCSKKLGTVIHEIGHALGFRHEQSRSDRDDYIDVDKENILEKHWKNFRRYPSDKLETYNMPYDYSSIMHYSIYGFSKNKKEKLKTLDPLQLGYDRTLGQRIELSFYDVKAANWRYCREECSQGLKWSKCHHDGYRNPKNCNECKCPDGWRGRYCETPAASQPAPRSCGHTFLNATTKPKSLTSPGYNTHDYSPDHECSCLIRAPRGHRVQFKFEGTFRLTCYRSCRDYVEVRFASSSQTGPRYCCRRKPTRIFTSKRNEMLILFRTFSGKGEKGFKAEYRSIKL